MPEDLIFTQFDPKRFLRRLIKLKVRVQANVNCCQIILEI